MTKYSAKKRDTPGVIFRFLLGFTGQCVTGLLLIFLFLNWLLAACKCS